MDGDDYEDTLLHEAVRYGDITDVKTALKEGMLLKNANVKTVCCGKSIIFLNSCFLLHSVYM